MTLLGLHFDVPILHRVSTKNTAFNSIYGATSETPRRAE